MEEEGRKEEEEEGEEEEEEEGEQSHLELIEGKSEDEKRDG
jgi:hypothetical protein